MGKSKGNSSAKKKKKASEEVEKKFLETLPGILAALAAVIVAVGGCVTVLSSPQILDRFFPQSDSTPTAVQATVPSPVITETPAASGGAVGVAPRIFDFKACPVPCNGKNSTNNFAAEINRIYVQFNYENFGPDIPYTRTWSMGGREWIRYACHWDGPSSGTETFKFSEPKGLASGLWEIKVMVDDVELLREEIVILGDWNYWDPAGVVNSCHSTN